MPGRVHLLLLFYEKWESWWHFILVFFVAVCECVCFFVLLLSYWFSRSLFFFCFFPFVFFWLLQVNCGKLCCRFHFLPNCTQQSTDFFYATFALTLLDLIIHYKYINRNIHLICTVLCKSYCNFYNTEEKNMCNKQKLRMISLHSYYALRHLFWFHYLQYLLYCHCGTKTDWKKVKSFNWRGKWKRKKKEIRTMILTLVISRSIYTVH